MNLRMSPSPLNGERAGVRGENWSSASSLWFMVPTHVRNRRSSLSMNLKLKVPTSPRPSPPKGRRGRLSTSPSPLNGERAGVRGENAPARPLSGSWSQLTSENRRSVLSMNLEIQEARRAGSSLAQAGGLGIDVTECRRPVGPRFPSTSRALARPFRPVAFLHAGFPGRCPGLRHRAPSALVQGPNSRPKSEVSPTHEHRNVAGDN
jgi:hypothetical protein